MMHLIGGLTILTVLLIVMGTMHLRNKRAGK